VVLSDRTRGLLGKRELGLMKPTAYLVNTSRGPIIDESALVETLTARRIAGAGLDVYDVEPLHVDHPLRTLDNVVLTPHTGYITDAQYRVFFGEAVENIMAFIKGAPVRIMTGPYMFPAR
jgi:phosphoglycerate dehydrogenase-like enzyme